MGRLRLPRSVRPRLLILVALAVAAVLLVSTLIFNVVLARTLSDDADRVALTRATERAAAISLERPDATLLPEGHNLGALTWIWSRGRLLEEPHVAAALNAAALAAARHPGAIISASGGNAHLRAVLTNHGGQTYAVVAGVSLAPYQRVRRLALVGSLAFTLLCTAIVALAAYLMLRAALRPVDLMAERAARWSEIDQSQRFSAGEPHDELTRLAATLDLLLERVSASLQREQRFSAEIAHELRTPLSAIKTEVQVALRRLQGAAAYRAALARVGEAADAAARTVDWLVLAARVDADLSRGQASIAPVLEQLADGATNARGLKISAQCVPEGLRIGVEAEVALRVLQPLLDNARRHAASTIQLSARQEDGHVVVRVTDDGDGVAEGNLERIFKAGVRGAAGAASGGPDGAGLGLALARRLARAAGGDVTASPDGPGATFVVSLPGG